MVHIKTLLPELNRLVIVLAEDLLARATGDAEIDAGLRHAFKQIEKGGRTAQAYEVWREDYLDQVAVAWVLACVFVRFLEDNRLIDECWLAGEGERRKLAEDTHEIFFRHHPHDTDREYFQHVFHEVGKIPAARDLFAEGKTPLWAVGPSGDAAMKQLRYWREIDAEGGHLKRSFEVEDSDTRFLGDLYEELSERAQKKYALKQTPVFVEEFILDRTLNPAIEEFGLETVRMIDPTCGSGHFLLGGFARLFDLWMKREENEIATAQKALDGIWGVDINPFAVAIARFRLIVAAAHACGIKRLKEAPGWKIHLATGDSLLFGSRWTRAGGKVNEQAWLATEEGSWAPEIYACEDKDAIQEVLGQQYHAVVGNPPYITVRDRLLNEAYRRRYATCHRKYSLAVPFAERFFDLAVGAEHRGCGYVGMITANSFMKREFGKKLVEEFFPKVDLTHVIDTSGAYIPGHTTSTVILFGRNRKPLEGAVRSVLGIKGEPNTPTNPSLGIVWQSIVQQIDRCGTKNAYVSSNDLERSSYRTHPWSIGGGGAAELTEVIEERAERTLADMTEVVGIFGMTNADEVFLANRESFQRRLVETNCIRQLLLGDEVREWTASVRNHSIFPYNENGGLVNIEEIPQTFKWLWPSKTVLGNRATFSRGTYFSEGRPWWKWHQVALERIRTPLTIVFSEIATHNHFVLDRGGTVFNRTAPIIKLRHDATEHEHLALLGFLNTSTACFWMKQAMPCKGLGGQGGGIKPETWSRQYVHAGTMLEKCPIPGDITGLTSLAVVLDDLACQAKALEPVSIVKNGVNSLTDRLAEARQRYESIHRMMVAYQEELDWRVYTLLGLCEGTTASDECLAKGLHPEDRPVERLLRERIASGEHSIYYDVHVYRGTGERINPPSDVMEQLIHERIEIVSKSQEIRLIEQLDFKRRWQVETWTKQQQTALRVWMLSRLERSIYWPDPQVHEPTLQSTSQLADKASGDHDFLQVAALYRGRPDFDVAALVAELVEGESVPSLPVLRYKSSGLRKRAVWERTWELQRKQDTGEDVGDIPVPPSYVSSDLLNGDFWRLRGKLDVPKERWISYPHLQTDSDPSLFVGWAGWDHLQQATALVAYYEARKHEGWDGKRLAPILAGLDQLLPWIHQWHPEIDPEFGDTAGQSYQALLENDAHELGLTLDDIRNWQPPQATTRRRART